MKVSDEASQTDDAQMRAALDAMPHKVWMVRPEGPALYYNRAMRAFAGAALNLPDRASPRAGARFIPTTSAGLRWLADAALADPQDWNVEARLMSGRRVAVASAELLDAVARGRRRGVARHRHRHRRAAPGDGQGPREQDFVRLAAEAAQLGVYSFDLETREHIWSPELKAIVGLEADAPTPADIMELIHPEDRERVRALRLASFEPAGSRRVRGRASDRAARWNGRDGCW